MVVSRRGVGFYRKVPCALELFLRICAAWDEAGVEPRATLFDEATGALLSAASRKCTVHSSV